MITGGQALLVFYAIFWGGLMSSMGRYRAFETSDLFVPGRARRSLRRLGWAILIVNAFPIVWLLALYNLDWIVPKGEGITGIVAAGAASLSLFGWHRIFHGVVATERRRSRFYSFHEWREVIRAWRGSVGEYSFHHHRTRAHLVPGLLFVFVYPGLAALITLLGGVLERLFGAPPLPETGWPFR